MRNRYEGWTIVARYGRRRWFEILGTDWKFSASIAANIIPNDIDYVGLATKAFEATGGPRTLPGVLRYMTVLADLQSPIAGSTGLVSIPITGYI